LDPNNTNPTNPVVDQPVVPTSDPVVPVTPEPQPVVDQPVQEPVVPVVPAEPVQEPGVSVPSSVPEEGGNNGMGGVVPPTTTV